jgi:hypothetical protein
MLRRPTVRGRTPAVHRNICSGHEAGLVAGEKRDDICNFMRLAHPPEWNSLGEFGKQVAVVHHVGRHPGSGQAGTDRIDPDPFFA